MGEKQKGPFQLSFNASLKVDFQGSRVTSDGGLIVIRELDERLGLGYLIAEHLSDARRGKNTQLPLADLFRQSVYSRMAGYEDVNDRAALAGPGVSADWVGEGLGSWRSFDLPLADVRDRDAGRGREFRWAGGDQPRPHRQGGGTGFAAAGGAGHGQHRDSGLRSAGEQCL